MKKSKQTIYRQGDVLVIAIGEKPTSRLTPVEREGGRVVLAHGELTGHAHAIADEKALMFAIEGVEDRLLVLPAMATLGHEEHTHIDLPAGDYIVRRQREYSPEEIRNVAD